MNIDHEHWIVYEKHNNYSFKNYTLFYHFKNVQIDLFYLLKRHSDRGERNVKKKRREKRKEKEEREIREI